ncbi:MAG: NAD(P)H-hydrate dehydratase [Acidimicrobiia bacterium]|nr:NAD(P)H-hydrate dehydratase [Acidimicrobiia bacterium]
MRPVITPEESARLDEAASDPVETLMDRAGAGIARAAAQMGVGYGSRVIALAGPGNNGGDAYVAARLLRGRGAHVEVRALGYPRGDWSAARKAACAAVAAGVRVRPLGPPDDADLVVDGLFGAGFHGSLPDDAAAWAEAGGRVLSVDLPSGLDGTDGSTEGPVFRAERTVTFHALKVGHVLGDGPTVTGEVEVVDIGLTGGDPALRLCEDADAPAPPRERTAHKWSTGAVLVVGGSPGLEGAAVLAGRAALEAGAGYVRVACHPDAAGVVTRAEPSLTTMGWEPDDVLTAAERFDVIALGTGLGPGDDAAAITKAILDRWDGVLVLDADGLTAASARTIEASAADVVLTPHAGEFERLFDEAPGLDAIERAVASSGAVVLAKGGPTIVAGRERWAVTSGGSELATLGSGDVLTGMIAAFAARGLPPEVAARSAAHRHGRAGAAIAGSRTVTASRLVDEIGRWSW